MNISETFDDFLENLKIDNEEIISRRYKRITKTLNSEYRNIDDEVKFSLYGGSYGRDTAIKAISDIDMLAILPNAVFERFNKYESNGQSALLQEVKNRIKKTYPKTEIAGDGQVVVVSFSDMQFEVVPVFEIEDGKFRFPNTNDGGSWEVCDPRKEFSAINDLNNKSSKNYKRLCRMVRSWKNECGVAISGMLIDTICYSFIEENLEKIKELTKKSYDSLVKDFFEWLKNQDDEKEYWIAPGSGDKIYNNKKSFCNKAKSAFEKCCDAIEKNDNITVNNIWREIFGNNFPNYIRRTDEATSSSVTDNEQFIEEKFTIDIKYNIKIDCNFSQDGFREDTLRAFLKKRFPLSRGCSLKFKIASNNVPEPFDIYWKVRNIGAEAEARNCLRGQITRDGGSRTLKESTSFWGSHYVEAFAVKNNICVARDRINVPIS